MSEQLSTYVADVLQRHFGPGFGGWPPMRHADLEKLLTDDAHRRRMHGRQAAIDWGAAERLVDVEITSEHWVITPRGLVYIAELRGSVPGERTVDARRSLSFVATPTELFEPIADRAGVTILPVRGTAVVDSRLNSDLVFPWPLDVALRRLLDDTEGLRLALAGH